jgi:hypothetical protein
MKQTIELVLPFQQGAVEYYSCAICREVISASRFPTYLQIVHPEVLEK